MDGTPVGPFALTSSENFRLRHTAHLTSQCKPKSTKIYSTLEISASILSTIVYGRGKTITSQCKSFRVRCAGMIKVTIRQAARKAGIKNAHQLQKRAGISPTMAAYLWRGDKLPELETLDRLCGVLECELSDLIHRNGHTAANSQRRAKATKSGTKGLRSRY